MFDTVTKWHKVGKTVHLDTRLRALASATPNELVPIWYIASNDPLPLEKEWKGLWATKNVMGEWFRLTEEDVKHFRSIRSVKYADALPGTRVPFRDPLHIPPAKKGKARERLNLGTPIIRRQLG